MAEKTAFSLVEVVLALGVLFVSILALIGLLSPMLQSVDQIEKIDEISSVVNSVNSFLQNSPLIAIRDGQTIQTTKFEAIYEAVAGGDEATVFVYRYYDDNDNIRLAIGFSSDESGTVGPNSIVNASGAEFSESAGPIYRVVLTASSALPLRPTPMRSADRNGVGIYTLTNSFSGYEEGALALEARVFAEDPPGPAGGFEQGTNLSTLADREPNLVFNTAVLR